ncbi:MAG: nucleoside hydrolase [Clostridia bacterium]|nr:nucleoside hydrolase [Clostridia bacterium]
MKVVKKILKGILFFILSIVVLVAGFFAIIIFNNSNGEDYTKDSYEVNEEDKIKVILDCDNSLGSFWEVDDGLVLSYLLNKPEADLLGVTTTFGNRTYDHKYTVNMLEKAGRTDIPVFKGEQTPNDGITDAAIFLAETVAMYPGEVSIIAAGPVGNLAAAYEYDNNFYNNVKQITVMGGYTEDLTMGNREIDELNLSADYKATYEMINSGANVTIMTGQACLDAPFKFSDFKKLKYFPADWEFFCAFWTVLNKVGTGNNYFVVWDMLPTIYMFHPEYFEDNYIYINSTLEDLEKGYLKISDSGEGARINVPDGIFDTESFFEDMFVNLNRQGR